MNQPITPAICLAATACMITAATSHWWSVRQLTATIDPAALAVPATPVALAETPEPASVPAPVPVVAEARDSGFTAEPPVGESLATQQQFYQELLREMQHLRAQNRDLLNQVAETNRDLMKLEFRVDTHSEQFRPMPVAGDRFVTSVDPVPFNSFDSSFDDGPGLLPPRAEPVELPSAE